MFTPYNRLQPHTNVLILLSYHHKFTHKFKNHPEISSFRLTYLVSEIKAYILYRGQILPDKEQPDAVLVGMQD